VFTVLFHSSILCICLFASPLFICRSPVKAWEGGGRFGVPQFLPSCRYPIPFRLINMLVGGAASKCKRRGAGCRCQVRHPIPSRCLSLLFLKVNKQQIRARTLQARWASDARSLLSWEPLTLIPILFFCVDCRCRAHSASAS
jgi:hypothetical protein